MQKYNQDKMTDVIVKYREILVSKFHAVQESKPLIDVRLLNNQSKYFVWAVSINNLDEEMLVNIKPFLNLVTDTENANLHSPLGMHLSTMHPESFLVPGALYVKKLKRLFLIKTTLEKDFALHFDFFNDVTKGMFPIWEAVLELQHKENRMGCERHWYMAYCLMLYEVDASSFDLFKCWGDVSRLSWHEINFYRASKARAAGFHRLSKNWPSDVMKDYFIKVRSRNFGL